MLAQALHTIHSAIIPQGIMATACATQNYNRIWSRDGAMTGIAGILLQDEKIIAALKQHLLTLQQHQLPQGQIPSNVAVQGNAQKPSYGTLVGRVDATTWYIVAACIYIKYAKDKNFASQLENSIAAAINVLQVWQFNNKELIYTPLGGNWADEYIAQGYTLYDNCLQAWALSLAGKIYSNVQWLLQAEKLCKTIAQNFSKAESATQFQPETYYHYTAFQKAKPAPYMLPSFAPNGYGQYFDMAGNAFALLLQINSQPDLLHNYIVQLQQEVNSWMLPVFYPVIQPTDADWQLLNNNFLYQFKNHPYCFHNGGSWPIMLGWLGIAFASKGDSTIAQKILEQYEAQLQQETQPSFTEYYNIEKQQWGGVPQLCYSASGYILISIAAQKNKITQLQDILL